MHTPCRWWAFVWSKPQLWAYVWWAFVLPPHPHPCPIGTHSQNLGKTYSYPEQVLMSKFMFQQSMLDSYIPVNSCNDILQSSTDQGDQFSQLQDATDAPPCHIHLPVCLWIMDPHSRAPKKNTNHGNEVLPQDATHLIQRPCYQRGSPCQDPAGNWTTWRSPDDRKEMQTAMAVSYTHLTLPTRPLV